MLSDDLRNAWRTDSAFKDFLGVEFQDLEPGVAPLVHVLWQHKVVETRASCHGHAGKSLPMHLNYRSTRESMFVFSHAHLLFNESHLDCGLWFVKEAQRMASLLPFVKLRPPDRGSTLTETWNIILGMEDIAVDDEKREVPEALAVERIKLFAEVWDELATAVIVRFGTVTQAT